jgi:hypothetical protein
MRTIITLTITAFLLTGCAADWMKVNCGWTDQVLPIQPSRKDKLTRNTQEQIVAANEAQEANCR